MPRRRVYGTGLVVQDARRSNALAFHFLNLASSQEYATSTVKDYLDDMMQYNFELEIYIQDGYDPEVTYAYGKCHLSPGRDHHWLGKVRQSHEEQARNSEYMRQRGYAVGARIDGRPDSVIDPDPKRMRLYGIEWVGVPTESKPGILQALVEGRRPVRITVQESIDIDAYFGEALPKAEVLGEPAKPKTPPAEAPK